MLEYSENEVSGFLQNGEFNYITKGFPVYLQFDEEQHRSLGKKQFELTNHLGNVLATISDRKVGITDAAYSPAIKFDPAIISAQDYYPFGMIMPKRSVLTDKYRFGFNGQEKDDEIAGVTGSHYTAQFWEYDSRLGRRWNVDPVVKFNEGSYVAFSNNPIWLIDPIGADTAIFGADNKFVEIKPGGDYIGQKLGDDGFFFNFVDPENDMKSIENGDINELYIAENKTILKDLDRAGVNKEENKGLIDGPLYLKDHSHAGTNSGELDFVIQSEIFGSYTFGDEKIAGGLPSNKLYITKVNDKMIAHNNYNFGNFMWGASANALDVSLSLTLLGAHANNYLNDVNNQGKSWYERDFDSKDDQLSITLGWFWRNSLKK